jgi:hypothetical protein
MYVLPVDASLNKLIVNTQCTVSCNVSKCSVTKTIELSRPYLHIPEIKTTCEHHGVVQSACDTERAEQKWRPTTWVRNVSEVSLTE